MTSNLAVSNRRMPPLLVVEDSNEDFEALQRLLARLPLTIPIQRCINGDQALACLYRTGAYEDHQLPRPGLIMLDLNLPGTDGREVLRRIKQEKMLKEIPIVIFTTSSNPQDIEDCYQYGVNSYIIKPINFAQLKRDVQVIVDYWFVVTTLPSDLED
ncbi:response regulator [Nodosilinea sp. PGN35]|uniref:response regulator n=1 Tax=Nodosilinea sp. PGN35 TaxID=3020489 RepID=UPI0023B277F1|nr:response regulator [Nodosilinea sp. TSF1-S3]MDF0369752.1 response regulator [Nodosilinea sp. TSF1-S3]